MEEDKVVLIPKLKIITPSENSFSPVAKSPIYSNEFQSRYVYTYEVPKSRCPCIVL
jgi:hypothetical protein